MTGLSSPTWRKSSYSVANGGECIEVADNLIGIVPVRDSKNLQGPTLTFTSSGFAAFVEGVKSGSFAAA